MRPGSYDYEVEGGDCLPLHVSLLDGDENQLDLTGYSSVFYAYWDGGSITLSTADDTLDITDADSPSTGEIVGELTAAQTEQLPYGKLTQYEWSYTAPSGCKTTFLKGYIERT